MSETKNTESRGQVGIGTLIVFIALVLVAAIAAGVLINTAGFLQSQAEATGQESTDQVSNSLQVVDAQATSPSDVDGTTTNSPGAEITVTIGPGSSSINISNARIEFFGDISGSVTAGEVLNDGSSVGVSTSDPVIRSADEYAVLDLSDGTPSPLGALDEGQRIEVVFTTPDGSQTTTVLNVPDPIRSSSSAVSL